MASLYFSDLDDAIKEAKKRAQSFYQNYYVYQDAQKESPNLFVSMKKPYRQIANVKAKVTYESQVQYYDGDIDNGGIRE